ncbi:transglycosylase domain-containing protein [Flavobacterium undicola]|uniref:transglycosylase domain-containing protein n=1 Tax=Flavobacterium undicola TaxID=1932779 RepID=UPI001377C687|nr:transglycosylase domain-containing protein [Flavobacterium undicola]MBA0885257.1 transglycosylase domain-containing protein [Flavobacterium undicola]
MTNSNKEFVYLTHSLKKNTKNNKLNPFILIYNKIHQTVKERRCQCEIIMNYIGPYRHGFSLTKKLYLLKIKKDFTQDDCLKFALLNADFSQDSYSHDILGVEKASKFYFQKEIDKLNEKEKITLIIMLEHPILYNPHRNPKIALDKIRLYQRILHMNMNIKK